jgi:hypothetical protein
VTGDAVTWLVAAWQVLTAAGIAVFWTTWFRQPHAEAWQPPGYVEHERVFVFPDTTLAALLVASAVLLLLKQPLGASLALVCAGMLGFLGIIDAAYFAQHGMYARDRDGPLNAFLVVAVLALAVVLALRYA